MLWMTKSEKKGEKKFSQFQKELISNKIAMEMEWGSQLDLPRPTLSVSKHHWMSLQLVSRWLLAPGSLVRQISASSVRPEVLQTAINYERGDLLERVSQNGLQEFLKHPTGASGEIQLLLATHKGPEAK